MSQTGLIQYNPEKEVEWVLKLCLIGSSQLKTTLSRRVADNKFDVNYMPTLGVDIKTKRITVDNQRIKLILMDTASQELFGENLGRTYYEGASACIIFFEKHDDDSFSAVPDWIKDFRSVSDCPIVLVGIITDAPEQVSYASARKYALYWGLEFYAIKSSDTLFFEDILINAVKLYFQKISSS
ncbi:MAG: Rab family GTPase [Candidatus Hodarchaeota archaeon]